MTQIPFSTLLFEETSVPTEWLERYDKERAAAFLVVAAVREQNQDIFESEAELQAFINENIHSVRKQAR